MYYEEREFPDGWVLVPRWNMERIAETLERDGDEHGAAYEIRAMLAAAPPPPSAPVGAEGLAKRIETYHWDVDDKPAAAKFAAELRSLTQQAEAVDEDLRKELAKAAKCARKTERSIERAKALLAGQQGGAA